MSANNTLSSTTGFYQTALDSLMDTLFISSTPYLEPTRKSFKLNHIRNFAASNEDEKFYTVRSTRTLDGSDNDNDKMTKNEQSESSTSSSQGDTPKRIIAGARKQRLFFESESDVFQPRTRITNTNDLTPQSQLLRKAIMRMECLQRRQERIALSKKPARTSLRV